MTSAGFAEKQHQQRHTDQHSILRCKRVGISWGRELHGVQEEGNDVKSTMMFADIRKHKADAFRPDWSVRAFRFCPHDM